MFNLHQYQTNSYHLSYYHLHAYELVILLETPWSTLLAMLDLLICMFIIQPSPAPTPRD